MVRTDEVTSPSHVWSAQPFPLPSTPLIHFISLEICIVMEDVSAGFVRGNVMDLKLGRRSVHWHLHHPNTHHVSEKKEKMLRKDFNSTTSTLGIRLAGMRMWTRSTSDHAAGGESWTERRLNTSAGRALSQHGLNEELHRFLELAKVSDHIHHHLSLILHQLESIIHSMEHHPSLCCISTSLLCIYEAQTDADVVPHPPVLRLIDFAHVERSNQKDVDVLFGLYSFRRILLDILGIPSRTSH
jgi:hypothetical protein